MAKARITIKDLATEHNLGGMELKMIKGGIIGDCGMPRCSSFLRALPGDPSPGSTRGLIRWVGPEGLVGATPIEMP